jgi:tetratricopeptide (TPR) repeat protein
MKALIIFLTLFLISCSDSYIKTDIGPEGKTVKIDNITLNFPEDALSETTTIWIKKLKEKERTFKEGYKILPLSFSIKPGNLTFEKPVLISIPTSNKNVKLSVNLKNNYLPLSDSRFENNTLETPILHGGNYTLMEEPKNYGILNASETKEALLIVSDIHTGNYLENFRKYLKQNNYSLPIWTFVYPGKRSVEKNAQFLAEELKNLHKQYGDFRLDIISFGVGGLVFYRYVADTTLYQRDISPSIISVGTPFKGSAFSTIENVKKGESPFRFYFIDGMGEQAKDLAPESDLISWIRENKLVGWRNKNLEENKNFASIRGKRFFTWNGSKNSDILAEESNGDGLVSLSSTMLTFIEPSPFPYNHFQLYEKQDVFETLKDFLELYHSFNWPSIFTKVWKGEEKFNKINEIWEKEIKLHFRSLANLQLLLDFNKNMLLSVPRNGILVTNGDNDTYPAWYLQGKGIRNDVLIVNWALFNIADNAIYLKNKGLPIPLSDEEIRNIRATRKKAGEILFPADSLIKTIVDNKQRPLVFASTVYHSKMEQYPLKLSGLAFEIEEEEGDVDIEKTKDLFHKKFALKTLYDVPAESLNMVCGNMLNNYRGALFKLINALIKEKRYDEALEECHFAQQFPVNSYTSNMAAFYCLEASIYYELKQIKKGDRTLENALDIGKNSNIISTIAKTYYENNRKEKAISTLSGWLKDHPDDSDILKQLMEYGEK